MHPTNPIKCYWPGNTGLYFYIIMKKLFSLCLFVLVPLTLVTAQYPNLISKAYLNEDTWNDAITLLPYDTGFIYIELHGIKDTSSWNTTPNYVYRHDIKVYAASLDMTTKTELFGYNQPDMFRTDYSAQLEATLTDSNELLVAIYDGLSAIRVNKFDLAGNMLLTKTLYMIDDMFQGSAIKLKEINDTISLSYVSENNIHWIKLDHNGELLRHEIFPWDSNSDVFLGLQLHYLFEHTDDGKIIHEYKVSETQNAIVCRNLDGSVNWAYTIGLNEAKPLAFTTDTVSGNHYLITERNDGGLDAMRISSDFSSVLSHRYMEITGSGDMNKVSIFKKTGSNTLTLGYNRNSGNTGIINMDLSCVPTAPVEWFSSGTVAGQGTVPQRTPLDMFFLPPHYLIMKNRLYDEYNGLYYYLISTADIDILANTCHTNVGSYSSNSTSTGPGFSTFTPSFLQQFSVQSMVGNKIDTTAYPTDPFDFYGLCATDIGIEENHAPAFDVFPNPVQSFSLLNIHGPESLFRYQLTSIEGKTILAGVADNSVISLDNAAPGIYILTLYGLDNELWGTHKIIVSQ